MGYWPGRPPEVSKITQAFPIASVTHHKERLYCEDTIGDLWESLLQNHLQGMQKIP